MSQDEEDEIKYVSFTPWELLLDGVRMYFHSPLFLGAAGLTVPLLALKLVLGYSWWWVAGPIMASMVLFFFLIFMGFGSPV